MGKEKTLSIIKKKLELLRNEIVIDLMIDARNGESLFETFKKYENQRLFLEKELNTGNNVTQLDLEQAIKNEINEKEENWRL